MKKIMAFILGIIIVGSTTVVLAGPLDGVLGKLKNSDGSSKITGQLFATSTPRATATGIVTKIFNIAIEVAGAIFMIMLLIGGIQYLTGAGNEDATGTAKKRMLDAIIGLVIVLASWAIGVFVINQLK